MEKRLTALALSALLCSPLSARDDDFFAYRAAPQMYQSPGVSKLPRYQTEMYRGAIEGDFIKQPTFFNIVGNIAINFTPASIAADTRDFAANFKKSYQTGFSDYKKDMALAGVGFIPVIGESKKFKGLYEAGKEARFVRQMERMVQRFAPAMESGLARKLQAAICKSLKDGEYLAVRSRVYGANALDGKLPAKALGDMVETPFKNGVRLLKDKRRVISDLDMAFVLKGGKVVPESHALKLGGQINATYGYKVITHGDNYNGARKGIQKAVELEKKEDAIYVFTKKGFLDSGTYRDMLRRYTGR